VERKKPREHKMIKLPFLVLFGPSQSLALALSWAIREKSKCFKRDPMLPQKGSFPQCSAFSMELDLFTILF
jgi:hypothetical protein